ncbi:MAG: hypothetical protein GF418_12640 [Chitinivibrionales bacterium]|nr:hypothetical protein [Chitinivibrionales bacterium]MBD3396467.1 hypothetical protein [Chitinivibrionales bacterium]
MAARKRAGMDSVRFSEHSVARVSVFDGFEDLARQTADLLTSGRVAFSGGQTFAKLFPQWVLTRPDVSNASFFPVDERLVPFNDPASNWGTAYRGFLAPLDKEHDKEHWPTSRRSFADIVGRTFGDAEPVFDVVFLGVGDDGHTASLFPGGDYLKDRESIVLETRSPNPPHGRVTLGPRPLVSAARLVTVLAGVEKGAILKRIAAKDPTLPIVRILSARAESDLFIEDPLLDAAEES